MKKQKGEISYEYIVLDEALAVSERASHYIISVNNILSLDYELKHGLEKTKPLGPLHFISVIFLIPYLFLFGAFIDYAKDASKINEVFKTPANSSVILSTAEELNTIQSSSYVKIENTWLYNYKHPNNYRNKNYVIPEEERNSIYNHPFSGLAYDVLLSKQSIEKPKKETLEKLLKNSSSLGNIDAIIEKEYQRQLTEYKNQVIRLENIEAVLDELNAQTFITTFEYKISKKPIKKFNSIKENLEKPIAIEAYYSADDNKLISLKQRQKDKNNITNGFITCCILLLVFIYGLMSLFKIIRNSYIQLQLAKEQLNTNNFKQLN